MKEGGERDPITRRTSKQNKTLSHISHYVLSSHQVNLKISLPNKDKTKTKTKKPVGPHTTSPPARRLALFLLEKRLSPRSFLPTYHGLKCMYFSRDAYAYIHLTGAEEVRAPHPAAGKRDNLLVASQQHTIVLQGWKFLAVTLVGSKVTFFGEETPWERRSL